jgi:Domain of unknown function (DUF4440)
VNDSEPSFHVPPCCTLTALFHDEAVFVHMGATMSKNQELDVIRSGGIQYKNVDIQDVSVRFIGTAGTTAILLNRIRLVAVVGGNEVTNPFVVTEVWESTLRSDIQRHFSFERVITSCFRIRATGSRRIHWLLGCAGRLHTR